MDKKILISTLIAAFATGCAYHEPVAVMPAPQSSIGFISASHMGPGTRVIINLSEQRAYLLEDSKIRLSLADSLPVEPGQLNTYGVVSRSLARILTIGLKASDPFSILQAISPTGTPHQAAMWLPALTIDPL